MTITHPAGPVAAAHLLDRAITDGGFTLDRATLSIEPEPVGYAVALDREPALYVALDAPDILDRITAALGEIPTDWVGGWVHGGALYLEGVEIWHDLEHALLAGQQRSQLAIFDLAAGEEITLPTPIYV